MISKWSLENFKSIGEKAYLEFAPLTIFTGANSSGKSSLIQSILMVAQTIQSNKDKDQAVVPNGDLVKLGGVKNIKSVHKDKEAISVGFSLSFDDSPGGDSSVVSCNFDFTERPIDIDRNSDKTRLLKTAMEFSNGRGVKSSFQIEYDPSIIVNIKPINGGQLGYDEQITGRMNDRVTPNELAELIDTGKIHDFYDPWGKTEIILNKNKKKIIFLRYGLTDSGLHYDENGDTQENIRYTVYPQQGIYRNQKLTLAGCKIRNFLPEKFITIENKKEYITKTNNRSEFITSKRKRNVAVGDYQSLPSYINKSISGTKDFFTQRLKYLGPLRDDPKLSYSGDQFQNTTDVGKKGEYTAYVLARSGKKLFLSDFCPYGATITYNFDLSGTTEQKTLQELVSEWLKYLEIADSVEAHYHSETDSYYFKIFKEGESYNLTQLGTGVSQVLPILVMCLAAEDGSTLIIDQPEMYLHPSMQAKLADFFFTITKYGSKQCIIESHSIFLIDQLRLRIAQEPIVHHSKKDSKFNLAELEHPGNRHVKIYFTENKNQNTNFRSVEIDEYGVPSEWPGEFFNVSLDIEDKLFEAVEIKRKKYEDMARD